MPIYDNYLWELKTIFLCQMWLGTLKKTLKTLFIFLHQKEKVF